MRLWGQPPKYFVFSHAKWLFLGRTLNDHVFWNTQPIIVCACALHDYVWGRALDDYVCVLGHTPKWCYACQMIMFWPKCFLRGKPKNWTPKVFWAKGFGLRGNQNHLNWTPKVFWAKGFWFKGKPKTTTNCNQNVCFWWPLTQILAHALFCLLYLNPKIWLNQAWLV